MTYLIERKNKENQTEISIEHTQIELISIISKVIITHHPELPNDDKKDKTGQF